MQESTLCPYSHATRPRHMTSPVHARSTHIHTCTTQAENIHYAHTHKPHALTHMNTPLHARSIVRTYKHAPRMQKICIGTRHARHTPTQTAPHTHAARIYTHAAHIYTHALRMQNIHCAATHTSHASTYRGVAKKKSPPIFPSAVEHGCLALNPCCKEISCSNFLCKCLTDHLEDSNRHHTPDPLLSSNFLTEPQFQAREVDAWCERPTRIPWPSLCVKLAHGSRNTVQKSKNEYLCVSWCTTHHKIRFLNNRNFQGKPKFAVSHTGRLCTPSSPTCGEIIVSSVQRGEKPRCGVCH